MRTSQPTSSSPSRSALPLTARPVRGVEIGHNRVANAVRHRVVGNTDALRAIPKLSYDHQLAPQAAGMEASPSRGWKLLTDHSCDWLSCLRRNPANRVFIPSPNALTTQTHPALVAPIPRLAEFPLTPTPHLLPHARPPPHHRRSRPRPPAPHPPPSDPPPPTTTARHRSLDSYKAAESHRRTNRYDATTSLRFPDRDAAAASNRFTDQSSSTASGTGTNRPPNTYAMPTPDTEAPAEPHTSTSPSVTPIWPWRNGAILSDPDARTTSPTVQPGNRTQPVL